MRVVIVVIAILFAAPAFADDCSHFQFPHQQWWQSSDTRLLETVEQVRKMARITEPSLVCEWLADELPGTGAMMKLGDEVWPVKATYLIMLSHVLTERLSGPALAAVIAHEHAHIAGGLNDYLRQMKISTPAENRNNERRMDAIAAGWVGNKAVRDAINEVSNLVIEHMQRDAAMGRLFWKYKLSKLIAAEDNERNDRLKHLDQLAVAKK